MPERITERRAGNGRRVTGTAGGTSAVAVNHERKPIAAKLAARVGRAQSLKPLGLAGRRRGYARGNQPKGGRQMATSGEKDRQDAERKAKQAADVGSTEVGEPQPAGPSGYIEPRPEQKSGEGEDLGQKQAEDLKDAEWNQRDKDSA